MEIRKISRRRPRSVDDAELGHFTLKFYRGRQRLFCSLNLLFSGVLVAVVFVVCLSSLMPRKTLYDESANYSTAIGIDDDGGGLLLLNLTDYSLSTGYKQILSKCLMRNFLYAPAAN